MVENTRHFHIRWIRGETSTTAIGEFDDSCERCAMFRQERKISN